MFFINPFALLPGPALGAEGEFQAFALRGLLVQSWTGGGPVAVDARVQRHKVCGRQGLIDQYRPLARPEHQVEVVEQETEARDRNGDLGAGMAHGLEENVVVAAFEQELQASVAAVIDVVTQAADGGLGGAGHRHGESRAAAGSL
jgi:hypothetical protein